MSPVLGGNGDEGMNDGMPHKLTDVQLETLLAMALTVCIVLDGRIDEDEGFIRGIAVRLDVTVPEASQRIASVIELMEQWGLV